MSESHELPEGRFSEVLVGLRRTGRRQWIHAGVKPGVKQRDFCLDRNRLLAVDPSLRSIGWALFDCITGRPLQWGLIRPAGPKLFLSERLNALHRDVTSLFSDLALGERDVLVCEGPAPLVLNPQSALKVEHVRGIFESVARAHGVEVPGRVNPRSVQSEVLGMRGKQLSREAVKAWARESAFRLYGEEIDGAGEERRSFSQDIVDALLVGTLAVSRVQLAAHSRVSLPEIFASGRSMTTGWRSRDLIGR